MAVFPLFAGIYCNKCAIAEVHSPLNATKPKSTVFADICVSLSLSLPLHPEGLACADGLWDLYNYRVCAGKDSGFRRFMGLRADRGKVSGFMR